MSSRNPAVNVPDSPPDELDHLRAQFPDGEPDYWACLGAITDRSVRVWLRDIDLRPHDAILRVENGETASAVLQPMEEHDGVAAADIELQRPAPGASFTLQVAGFTRRGRLAPAPHERASFSFGFGSCHQPYGTGKGGKLIRRKGAGIYRVMHDELTARDARFIAFVGDQV
ncbi:MAG: hypothetical protein O3B65_05640 [Chloroflexi bacterium]|nr:hypothetical protein [Chloroflexota bacterium]